MPYAGLKRTVERMMNKSSARRNVLACAAAAWLAIAAASWLTSYEFSLEALYATVIVVAGWHGGWRAGLLFAFASVANQWAVGATLGHPYSHSGYFIAATMNRLLSECMLAALSAGLRSVRDRERTYARVDPLTGLRNSVGFREGLQVELARHQREGGAFAVAYLDCAAYQETAARKGNANGDMLLRLVGNTLERVLRKTDIRARLDAGRYAILLPKTAMPQAQSVVQELLYALNMATAAQDHSAALDIGVGVFPDTPPTEDAVLSFVDGLLHQAKTDGTNEVVYEICPAWAGHGTGSRAGVASA